MKTSNLVSPLALAAILAGLTVNQASAQTLNKAANNDALLLATSWTENSVPTSANTLAFSNVWTGAQVQMGGNLNVAGIDYGNVANSSGRISGTAGQTLSLGGIGVDLNGTGGNLRIDPAIVLTANQNWSIAAGRILNLTANGMSGAFTAQVTGAGTLAFDASGTNTYGSQLEVDVTTLRINFSTTDATFTNANNSFTALTLFNGTGRFSSIANSGLDSAAGAFTTAGLGGNATNGIFVYTGNTNSTNRNFQVDRRSVSSGILVSTAGQTLTIGGNITHTGSNAAIANNAFRVGGDGNLILNGIVSNNTTAGFNTALVKEGSGILTLGGDNSFAGGVAVNVGTLLVQNTTGSGTGSGNVTVANLAAVGGDGSISGNLTLDSAARLVFSLTETLTVSGTVSLANAFSVNSLVNADGTAVSWGSVAETTYTLISNGSNFSNITNFGLANAANLGGGKSAYFTGGTSLSLVVIPEPSTLAFLAVGLGLAGVLRRRVRA